MPNSNILFQNQPTAPLTAQFNDALNTSQSFNEYQQMPVRNRLLESQAQGQGIVNQNQLINQQAAQQGIDRNQAMFQVADMAADAYELLPVLQGGDQFQLYDKLNARIEKIKARGGDPSDTINFMNAMKNGDMNQEQAAQELQTVIGKAQQLGVFGGSSSDISLEQKQFNELNKIIEPALDENGNFDAKKATAEQLAAAIKLRIAPGATGSAAITAATTPGLTRQVADSEATIKGATTRAQLMEEWDLRPSIAASVEKAVSDVKAAKTIKEEDRSNEKAFSVYETAITGLMSGLDGATTGPMVGWLPALTSNQQIADGAVAAMEPVLKGIFRGAGEGTFTDADAQRLLAMLPNRSTSPDARAGKLAMIDSIVRSKLGKPVMIQSSILGREVSMGEVFQEAVDNNMSIDEVKAALGIQ